MTHDSTDCNEIWCVNVLFVRRPEFILKDSRSIIIFADNRLFFENVKLLIKRKEIIDFFSEGSNNAADTPRFNFSKQNKMIRTVQIAGSDVTFITFCFTVQI